MRVPMLDALRASPLADAIRRRRIRRRLRVDGRGIFACLGQLHGIVHVGANTGQERQAYWASDLHVAWVEATPEIFEQLKTNIARYPNQRAIHALIGDRDFETVSCHIASNDSGSSSIYPLGAHAYMFPDIEYTRTIELRTMTLEIALRRGNVDPDTFDGLVVDVQGAELLVLKGAARMMDNFKLIQCEVADREIYTGACTVEQVTDFLAKYGFTEAERETVAESAVGCFYDVLYVKGRS